MSGAGVASGVSAGAGAGSGSGGGGGMDKTAEERAALYSASITERTTLVPVPEDPEPPTNNLVTPLLTDMYQLTMAYAYWATGRHEEHAVFDTFFRKNPFRGEFTVFSGLEEVLRFVQTFRFTEDQIAYVKSHPSFADADPRFFTEYLAQLDCSCLQIKAVPEGTVVFPRVPLIRLEGPIGVCQLLETTILNLVNYPTLMTTNAARFRAAAGADKTLLEFGLRRAQGPDGGLSASRYSYMGGFDGTSNVAAGLLFQITVSGTHAHSFITSYTSLSELKTKMLMAADGSGEQDFVSMATAFRDKLGFSEASVNEGEFAAFLAYGQAFPKKFLALVDTYDTLKSGIPNYIAVSLALIKLGYKPLGIRLDSGDLAYLSKEARRMFTAVDALFPWAELTSSTIVASNDINEAVLISLNDQGHEIDAFGIGTNLVTCQAQPALGMVFKLVEINGKPRIKLSQEVAKVTIPGKKQAYRLLGRDATPLVDLLLREGEDPIPTPGESYLVRHPAVDKAQAKVKPTTVIPLLSVVWDGKSFMGASKPTNMRAAFPDLPDLRAYTKLQLASIRPDHLRPLNPTPYKVSVSGAFYRFIHELWEKEAPVAHLE